MLALIAAAVGLGLLLRDPSAKDRANEVRSVSEKFTVALSSFDYRHLDQDFAKVRGMSTGGFRSEFDDLLGGQKAVDALRASQARSVATVQRGPYVASLSKDEARTFTVVQQKITNKETKQPQVTSQRISLYLLRLRSGGWKIDRVTLS